MLIVECYVNRIRFYHPLEQRIKNVYFKIKKADGQTVYLPIIIKCDKFRVEVGDDGFVECVKCIPAKVKRECKTCSLVNPAKKQKKQPLCK